ncbi:ribonuclease D [Paraferrimonas sedimenticola]|uniref:ribonuclease D n=1 Tax=Paraferrimonas sedimenticola TaxID=375674 RepID=UPI000BA99D82|nr:ribonuclease D [Paraferrimonas sedimenticola]
MSNYQVITEQPALDALIASYQDAPVLTLDTEFVRTRTYYAEFGLIQVYDGKQLALIDPRVGLDLSGFWALLTNPNIIKVLHSCSEDLDVFACYGKCIPEPLFDTQIASALLGHGAALGYAKLVEQHLGIVIDKGESRTDWTQRPLSQAQLDYAANDVLYLHQIYPTLAREIEEKGRQGWLRQECQRLASGRLVTPNPEAAYRKVKGAAKLNPHQLAVLRELASWRMNQALKRNSALGFVVKDAGLMELAITQPKSLNQLNQLTVLGDHEKRRHGKALLRCIEETDFDDLPEAFEQVALAPGYKSVLKRLKNCSTEIAEEKVVAIETLAPKRLLHQYLVWRHQGQTGELPMVLTGWRGELLAEPIEALKLNF